MGAWVTAWSGPERPASAAPSIKLISHYTNPALGLAAYYSQQAILAYNYEMPA